MSPWGLTLRQLFAMTLGKAELLGGTSAAKSEVLPYDPAFLQGAM